jgi:hypothetical protein
MTALNMFINKDMFVLIKKFLKIYQHIPFNSLVFELFSSDTQSNSLKFAQMQNFAKKMIISLPYDGHPKL